MWYSAKSKFSWLKYFLTIYFFSCETGPRLGLYLWRIIEFKLRVGFRRLCKSKWQHNCCVYHRPQNPVTQDLPGLPVLRIFISIFLPVVHQNITMLSGKRKQLVVGKKTDSRNTVYRPMFSYIIHIYAIQNFGSAAHYYNDKYLI